MSSLELLPQGSCAATLPFRVGIVGAGRVGGAIARALERHVVWIVARSPERRRWLRSVLPQVPLLGSVDEIPRLPEVVLLTVPDRAIEAVAQHVARRFVEHLSGSVVVHMAGALTTDVLEPIERFGGAVAAAHPFTMVPEPHPAWLYGVVWGIETAEQTLPVVEQLVRATGGVPYALGAMSAERKALYHAVAVLASNVITGAIASAVELAQRVPVPPSLFLPPILRATLESALTAVQSGTPLQRTGPLVRGDWETVERQLHALRSAPQLRREYAAFILALVEQLPESAPLQHLRARLCAVLRGSD